MSVYDQARSIILHDPELAREIVRQMAFTSKPRTILTAVGLTDKQREVLDFLRAWAKEHDGQTPSYRQIAEGVELVSLSGVLRLLKGLEERGYISRMEQRPRSIRLLEDV